MSNLSDFLCRSADVYPDKTAIVCGESRLTYKELQHTALQIARNLQQQGIGPEDKVALSCPNIPQFAMVFYAILATGASVVPLNILLRSREVEYHLQDSGAKAYFCFEGTQDIPIGTTGLAAFENTASCQHFYTITQNVRTREWNSQKTLAHLMTGAPMESVYPSTPNDTALVLYTSGTTGQPKGAELTHYNIGMNTLACQSFLQASSTDTTLIALPLFHCFALVVQMQTMVACGGTAVMMPRFAPDSALQLMADEKITLFAGVPTMYIALTQAANHDQTDLTHQVAENLRVSISGGAALPVEALCEFEEKFGVSVLEGYGLSETSPAAAFNSLEHERLPGSVGRPISGVQMRIVDENDQPLHPGQIGEVVIKGHNIMKGYLGRPEQTAEAIRNGWFHTGDIGRFDEKGNLYIVDRLKDMIIRGGYNIYPRELEEVLLTHQDIMLASVIGIPDDHYGEEIMACIVLHQSAQSSTEEIADWAKSLLGSHKYPRLVKTFDQLPMTATGKILKRELRQQVLTEAEV
ncbi:long-chain-fatty-acid--CoA ligase [Spongorhabdus nitratireducens]